MAGMRKKIASFTSIFRHLKEGQFSLFFQELVGPLPSWLIAYSSTILQKADSVVPVTKAPVGFTFSWANESDLEEISTLTHISPETGAKLLRGGDGCYIARDLNQNNALVNLEWVHRGPCYIRGLGHALRIDDSSACLYWAFTHPTARGHKLLQTTFNDLLGVPAGTGAFRELYAFTEHWNKRACEYHTRSGFRPIADSYLFKILGLHVLCVRHRASGKRTLKVFRSEPDDMPVI